MPAGTIKLINNSDLVAGVGTDFTTENLKPNDFIISTVGQTLYQLAVKSVDSPTAITLMRAYDGPDSDGLAWNPLLNSVLVGITDQITHDVARAFRMMYQNQDNWQKILTLNSDVTITNPDNSQTTGPSWLKIASALNNISGDISNKADKSEVIAVLDDKANKSDLTTLNNKLDTKANLSDLGTSASIDKNTASVGNAGWFKDTATGWIVQKGTITVASKSTRDWILPVGFSSVATCVPVCSVNSAGVGFTDAGDVMATMVSGGVVRLSNTNAVDLPVSFIIIGW